MKSKILGGIRSGAAGVLLALTASAAGVETGFQNIFNGTDLTGWAGHPELWSVKDRAEQTPLRVKSGKGGCTASFLQDLEWHRKRATTTIKDSPDGQWAEIVCDTEKVSGIHAVVVSFEGEGEDALLADWWKFE